MISRRTFVAGAAAIPFAGHLPPRIQDSRQVIDGLGEVRPEYGPALLDEIRASGLTGCLVTVGNPALQGATAFSDMADEVFQYERFVSREPSRLVLVRNAAGFTEAARSGRIGLLLYTQNATPIGDELVRLERLDQMGVRVVQLTYNSRNLLGDGCLERTDTGLSRFGLDAVARMNQLGMLVDLSHCGEATTIDGITHSTAPVAITHSGCRAVFDHPRNKSDRVLRILADRGGVIGIYQINPYLGPEERNTLEHYMAHLRHAINTAGVEHVGIGSDREYQRIPDTAEERARLEQELSRLRPTSGASFRWPFFLSELNHPRRMETIRDALRRAGYSARETDLVMGGNFHRLLHDTLG